MHFWVRIVSVSRFPLFLLLCNNLYKHSVETTLKKIVGDVQFTKVDAYEEMIRLNILPSLIFLLAESMDLEDLEDYCSTQLQCLLVQQQKSLMSTRPAF